MAESGGGGVSVEQALNAGGIVMVLNDWNVDHVVIGGAAAHAHGTNRQPSDLDVVIRLADDNLDNAVGALRELRAEPHFPGITAEERAMLPPSRLTAEILEISLISTWMTSQGPLDLFDGILARNGRTRDYHALHAGAVRGRIGGIPTAIAGIDALIESKLAVGRPKDHDDVAELRRVVIERAQQRHRESPSRGLGVERAQPVEIGR